MLGFGSLSSHLQGLAERATCQNLSECRRECLPQSDGKMSSLLCMQKRTPSAGAQTELKSSGSKFPFCTLWEDVICPSRREYLPWSAEVSDHLHTSEVIQLPLIGSSFTQPLQNERGIPLPSSSSSSLQPSLPTSPLTFWGSLQRTGSMIFIFSSS